MYLADEKKLLVSELNQSLTRIKICDFRISLFNAEENWDLQLY